MDGSLAILAPENIVMPETDFAWADVPDLPDILKKLRNAPGPPRT